MSSLTFISGRIGTVESKTLDSGMQITKFSVASDEREKVNGEWERVAEWYNCIMWGNENLIKFLKKGAVISFVARKKDKRPKGRLNATLPRLFGRFCPLSFLDNLPNKFYNHWPSRG